MRRFAPLVLIALAAVSGVAAQDLQRVASPDGQIEFRLFVDEPDIGSLFRLAYQVSVRGKPLIKTSFLGLLIHNQEPFLGEKVGLTTVKTSSAQKYNSLVADYLQDGSVGRRINVEVRAYNDGVAFRYVVPATTALLPMLLEDEETEFELDQDTSAIRNLGHDHPAALPFVTEQPGIGWVAIGEVRNGTYPHMYIARQEGTILISRLPRSDETGVAWEGTTPMTCPWRVITIGATRELATDSKILNNLK